MLYHHLYNNMLYHLFLFGCYITKYGDITTKYGFKNQKKKKKKILFENPTKLGV